VSVGEGVCGGRLVGDGGKSEGGEGRRVSAACAPKKSPVALESCPPKPRHANLKHPSIPPPELPRSKQLAVLSAGTSLVFSRAEPRHKQVRRPRAAGRMGVLEPCLFSSILHTLG
jgi:hypothetical protein